MNRFEKTLELTPDTISETVLQVINELESKNIDKKMILSLRLSLEEVLVNLMSGGKVKQCDVSLYKKWGKYTLKIISQGKAFNPLQNENDEFEFSSRLCSALNDAGLSSEYKYKGGCNAVLFHLPRKKLNPLVKNFIAILAAVVFSQVIRNVCSPETAGFIVSGCLEPTFNAFISLLSALASFMIFFSILSSIINMGDLSTFGKYGKKTISILFGRFMITAVILFTVCILCLKVTGSDTAINGTVFSDFYKTIIGIIPENLVSPFLTKNTLQITFLSACFGFIILLAGTQCKAVINVINDMNILIAKAVSLLCVYMPFCIFLSLSKLMLAGDFSKILQIWKLFVLIISFGFANTLISITYTSIRFKISFLKVLKGAFSCGLIGFMTSSSFAAYDNLYQFAVTENGVEKKNFEFTFSMMNVFCKMAVLTCLMAESLVLAEIFGVTFSPVKLLILFISLILMAISTPPVPSGSLAVWTSVLAICGIPADAIGIVIACDPFEDMIDTGFHIAAFTPVLIQMDRKLKDC